MAVWLGPIHGMNRASAYPSDVMCDAQKLCDIMHGIARIVTRDRSWRSVENTGDVALPTDKDGALTL